MLYGIGLMLILLSSAFVGGSPLVPCAIAMTGVVLMCVGKKPEDNHEAD